MTESEIHFDHFDLDHFDHFPRKFFQRKNGVVSTSWQATKISN